MSEAILPRAAVAVLCATALIKSNLFICISYIIREHNMYIKTNYVLMSHVNFCVHGGLSPPELATSPRVNVVSVQSNSGNIAAWCIKWCMPLSMSKCISARFTRKTNIVPSSYSIGGV